MIKLGAKDLRGTLVTTDGNWITSNHWAVHWGFARLPRGYEFEESRRTRPHHGLDEAMENLKFCLAVDWTRFSYEGTQLGIFAGTTLIGADKAYLDLLQPEDSLPWKISGDERRQARGFRPCWSAHHPDAAMFLTHGDLGVLAILMPRKVNTSSRYFEQVLDLGRFTTGQSRSVGVSVPTDSPHASLASSSPPALASSDNASLASSNLSSLASSGADGAQ